MSFTVRSSVAPRSFSSTSISSGIPIHSALRSSAASMFTGADGRGSRISVPIIRAVSNNLSSSLDLNAGSSALLHNNEKETMQGLNGRLAGYLSKVRGLEEANSRLEDQIKEVMSRRAPTDRDWSAYEKPLTDLRKQVSGMALDNARLVLQIDNARLAADDFKVKWEAELAMRQGVEQDIGGLRKIIDDTSIGRMQLENQIESLNEELAFLKRNHEEEVASIRAQILDSSVSVEVDAPKGVDLGEMITQIRSQYEMAAQKSREDTEVWYKNKFEELSTEVTQNTEALQSAKSELNDLHRQKKGLEIELQTLHNTNCSLEVTLHDTENRYNMEVGKLNQAIRQLEDELGQVRTTTERQTNEYTTLLNMKMKLEAEIATYRRLLEGEEERAEPLQPVNAEPQQQSIRRVVVINQELVDGKVVSQKEEAIEQ
ncbi:keratin, type I cytoskeletal 18-like [Acipenser oxyrinchus oxyrinchus]|uniref:Keratin, type I cytoskeletal 18-like n=1 Tax=Acipenser oxyrinchus oxyrinchus TaxID=40147 RepID=A0AAD8D9M3_ACIOX|nr:keratin, type I cytoskeletal 18-like [Acipenser oxyrinchus oxyrinchus]